ncbi:MAG: sigma-70 family RNA polymerase sigma factor, partial [Cyanobacteria bacterium REEB65]|nr:sigma-70 family RNA polymerase sigma factor [Cyanobacteria bacterium REEB65]
PTAEEIAAELHCATGKVVEVLELEDREGPISLDDDAAGESGKPLRYQLIDQRYRSFQLAAEDRIMLAQALERLKDVSREVIEFAFFEDLTQTEIAKKLGISQMQVSRRIRAALAELWKLLHTRLWD